MLQKYFLTLRKNNKMIYPIFQVKNPRRQVISHQMFISPFIFQRKMAIMSKYDKKKGGEQKEERYQNKKQEENKKTDLDEEEEEIIIELQKSSNWIG